MTSIKLYHMLETIYSTMLKNYNHKVLQEDGRIQIDYEFDGQFDGRLILTYDPDTLDLKDLNTAHSRKQHLVDAYVEQMASDNKKLGELK